MLCFSVLEKENDFPSYERSEGEGNSCKLLVCWNVNTLIARAGVSPNVPSLKEKSLVVVHRSVDSGGMIEIHVRYHRRHSSEIVKPSPIRKTRQMCVQLKSRVFFSNTRLGLRSPIVERNYCTYYRHKLRLTRSCGLSS